MTEETVELSEVVFDQPLEEEDDLLDVTEAKRKVYTSQGDVEVDSLLGKYTRGRLVIQPDFQRQFVWDAKKSSRLIESALLEIPLPVVYISEEQDGKESVIDGQQRLTAFFCFINGKFPNNRDFRLTGLKVYSELERKTFKDLDDALQDRIRYCKIRTITFKRESDPDLKFEVFERLNTGSVSLNDQELRNCIYRGPYNELLKELSATSRFRELLGIKSADKRMRDVELVLRFAAFYHRTYLNYKPPIRTFLNTDMEEYQHISEGKSDELRNAFKNTIEMIWSLLGDHAFKRFHRGNANDPDGYWEPKKFNASLYDVLMYCFAKQEKNTVFRNLDSIREGLIHLMTTDQEFIDAIELSTSSVQAITKRFDKWRMTLENIIGIQYKEPRCFSLQLKESLFNVDPTCTICGQRIQQVDDGAIDHVEQYWTGGKTIPENARLTHRYCNMARPRND